MIRQGFRLGEGEPAEGEAAAGRERGTAPP